jgi:hypothetical protein
MANPSQDDTDLECAGRISEVLIPGRTSEGLVVLRRSR